MRVWEPCPRGRMATYHLLVGEKGAVVDECHAVCSVAVPTSTGLSNTATVDFHPGRVGTYLALEEGLLHLRDQLGCPDDHATDGDELINVCKGREAGLSIRYCPWSSQASACHRAAEPYLRCSGAGDRWGQSRAGTLKTGLGCPLCLVYFPLNPSPLYFLLPLSRRCHTISILDGLET